VLNRRGRRVSAATSRRRRSTTTDHLGKRAAELSAHRAVESISFRSTRSKFTPPDTTHLDGGELRLAVSIYGPTRYKIRTHLRNSVSGQSLG